ncbi:MAG: putative hydro-lyase [Pseudomonadota bacterium]
MDGSFAGEVGHGELVGRPFEEVRAAIRAERYRGHTAGLAPGRLQVNLAILPQAEAEDFLAFCRANPKPCPLVGMSEAGSSMLPQIGADVDAATDAAGYVVWRDGEPVEERAEVASLWRDDLVAFALGCSFTFERALGEAGIAMRHIELDLTVPMFRTSIQTARRGAFGGGMVASLRGVPEAQLETAREVTGRYPWAHGEPIHVGDPAAIGISDIGSPDWGDPLPPAEGEVPVFWACGVTPQNALREARPGFCITHRPGGMLIAERGEMEETALI